MTASNNELEKLKVLVKANGIRLEQRNDKGETALMRGRAAHLDEAVRILIAAGAKQ
jgi:hypothetical protein